jgi:hypothetical protein
MFWKVFACLFLLLELTAAKSKFTMSPGFFVSPYAAGHDTMNLTWVNASGPITLWLENGPVEDLVQVERIAELPPSTTSYLYTPPVSLANGNYTFQIQDADGSNWSKWFTLTNGIGATSSSLSQSASNTPVVCYLRLFPKFLTDLKWSQHPRRGLVHQTHQTHQPHTLYKGFQQVTK